MPLAQFIGVRGQAVSMVRSGSFCTKRRPVATICNDSRPSSSYVDRERRFPLIWKR